MIAVISMWMSYLHTVTTINLQASPPLVRNESAKTAGTFGGADFRPGVTVTDGILPGFCGNPIVDYTIQLYREYNYI